MKNLLLITALLFLVSCGKKTLLTMPDIDFNHDSDNNSVEVSNARVASCNMQAYNNRCSYNYVGHRVLQAHELYNNFCLTRYRQCVGR